MSSTGGRLGNSRWRPTLAEPYRSPLAWGMAGRYLLAHAGAPVMIAAGLIAWVIYRHAPPAVRVDALVAILTIYAIATGAAVALSWRWAWRAATAEARGHSR